jgi:hypothetical protein
MWQWNMHDPERAKAESHDGRGLMKTAVIGAVEYRISSTEQNVVEARYLSTGSMFMRAGAVCRGRAQGDTSGGFPGHYVIRYFGVDDEPVGEFDWKIVPVGDGYSITWRNRPGNATIPVEPGTLVFEGFGSPNSDSSIVVAYWMTEPVSEAMERARQAA